MTNDMIPIGIDEPFKFSCSKQVDCFNACCRDLNQFLYPYDILRLKNRLGISSGDFLKEYTIRHMGPESGFPVITLKASTSSNLECPFVTPDGCSVYDDRPSSCRVYPIARAISRSRETGKITEYYAIIKEEHCHGSKDGKTRTVREWIENQGLSEYNEMNDMLMELISLKNRLNPEPLDLASQHLFQTAMYDLDKFRSNIFEKGLLDNFEVDDETLNIIKTDDTELLKLACRWVKKALFNM